MNNLTDYELLQHRHLSLLRALQDKGVTCVMGMQGWEVTMPVKCMICMDTGKVRDDYRQLVEPCPAGCCERYFVGLCRANLTVKMDQVSGIAKLSSKVLHLEIDGDDNLTGNTIDKWLVNRPMTPTIRHLLDALQAAIMEPAPAKA